MNYTWYNFCILFFSFNIVCKITYSYFVWLLCICICSILNFPLYECTTIHYPFYSWWTLGWCLVSGIENNIAMNILLHLFWHSYAHISLLCISRIEIDGAMVSVYPALLDNDKLLIKILYQFAFLPALRVPIAMLLANSS